MQFGSRSTRIGPPGLFLAGALLFASGAAAQDQDAPQESAPEIAQDAPATTPASGHISPAEFDENLDIGGEEIEARKKSSRMTVEVLINEQGPYKFIVDSGADTSVIGESLAARLGLPDAGAVVLNAMTESRPVEQVSVDSIQLGPTTTTDLDLPVLDERDIGADGMIGLDALVAQRLMMDFDKHIVTVDDEYRFPRSGPNIIVVTARRQRGQLILTEVQAMGHRVDAVIDTGTEVTIGNSALRDKLGIARRETIETVEIYGVTGTKQEIEFAVIPRLELGPVTFLNVPIAFADVPPFEVFGLNEEPSLLLGTDLMEKFRRISLDFSNRKVRFQLRKCRSQKTSIRTVGIPSRIKATKPATCTY